MLNKPQSPTPDNKKNKIVKGPAKKRRSDFVEKSERTRELILAAAEAEFVAQGLAGARMESIAKAAGVNKSLVYRHFERKELLFRTVLIEAYRKIRLAENNLPKDGDAETIILRFCEATLRYFVTNPNFLILVGIENLHKGENLGALPPSEIYIDALLDMLERTIQQGQAEGTFRDGLTPSDLWLLLSGQCWYSVATAYTYNIAFGENIFKKNVFTKRLKNIQECVRRYILKPEVLIQEQN